ncbi:hypothetical protein EDB89DRAFT_1911246 [Lactarius sanguifluus]|nr:hypothetical protein EDB89DRAFT_1911246 [Lactarius sanguifluus]
MPDARQSIVPPSDNDSEEEADVKIPATDKEAMEENRIASFAAQILTLNPKEIPTISTLHAAMTETQTHTVACTLLGPSGKEPAPPPGGGGGSGGSGGGGDTPPQEPSASHSEHPHKLEMSTSDTPPDTKLPMPSVIASFASYMRTSPWVATLPPLPPPATARRQQYRLRIGRRNDDGVIPVDHGNGAMPIDLTRPQQRVTCKATKMTKNQEGDASSTTIGATMTRRQQQQHRCTTMGDGNDSADNLEVQDKLWKLIVMTRCTTSTHEYSREGPGTSTRGHEYSSRASHTRHENKFQGNSAQPFNGDRDLVEPFLTQWEIYRGLIFNTDTIRRTFMCTLLLLSYIQGRDIFEWVQSQTKWLSTQLAQGASTRDEYLYDTVLEAFREAFTDTMNPVNFEEWVREAHRHQQKWLYLQARFKKSGASSNQNQRRPNLSQQQLQNAFHPRTANAMDTTPGRVRA